MAFNWVWGDQISKTVILDTNAVLMIFEFSLNIEDELIRLIGKNTILIPTQVSKELDVLAVKGTGKKKRKAAPAVQFVKRFPTVTVEASNADDAVLLLAVQKSGIVVTNDVELRKRLREHKIPVVFLRAKKKLVLEE